MTTTTLSAAAADVSKRNNSLNEICVLSEFFYISQSPNKNKYHAVVVSSRNELQLPIRDSRHLNQNGFHLSAG